MISITLVVGLRFVVGIYRGEKNKCVCMMSCVINRIAVYVEGRLKVRLCQICVCVHDVMYYK